MTLPPGDADHWFRQGVKHMDAAELESARTCFLETLKLDPRHAMAENNLGAVLQWSGLEGEAEVHYRRALDLDAGIANAWLNLAQLLHDRGQVRKAADFYRRAVGIEPDHALWHAQLASVLRSLGQAAEAVASARAAVRLAPREAGLLELLGASLLEAGEPDAAIEALQQSTQLNPALATAQSWLLYALNFSAAESVQGILAAHLAWARGRAVGTEPHGNEATAERKLRIGYLAPDFSDPDIACLIAAVLAAHDRSGFEVICYSDAGAENAACWRMRQSVELWHATALLDNLNLAQRIREDRIDILVDLGGHRAGGARLEVFASRPAPVQLSWPTYPVSTGLGVYDARITDARACPAGDERYFVEPALRIRGGQWCFAPQADAPVIASAPCSRNGTITFGAFHPLAQVSAHAVAAWAQVLRAVPGARLVIGAPGAAGRAAKLHEHFAQLEIDAGRVDCLELTGLESRLAAVGGVDIVLDSMPYANVAGTCHALWMGVPVVTRGGPTFAARGSASVLAELGFDQWIADSAEKFAACAAALAADPDRLATLRGELRARLEKSRLMDATGFTRDLEGAMRELWRGWCAGRKDPVRSAPKRSGQHAMSSPRVVVDGVFFQDYNTGIARVWRTILREWATSGFARNVVLLDRAGTAPDLPGVRRRAVPRHSYVDLPADRAMLQKVCDEESAQAFISTYYSSPLSTPAVMLVYDMIPEMLDYHLAEPQWQEKKACVDYARRYVAISNSTGRDLRRIHSRIDAGRVSVAYPAAESMFRPASAAEVDRFRSQHRIERPYFLMVGSRDVHYKNGRAFYRALAKLPDPSRNGVVLVGGEPELAYELRGDSLAGRVHQLRLDDAELRLAYCGAIALVYPSLYEGFGMPVLEAMSCGCPVITTSQASLPEVAGEAAIYVAPADSAGLALALAEVQRAEVRAPRIARGLERARSFSWARMAETVAAALSETAIERTIGDGAASTS